MVPKERYDNLLKKEKIIASEIERVEHTHVGTNKKVQNLLAEYGSTPLNSGATIADLIRRPELHYNFLAPIDERRPNVSEEVAEQVDINIKYDGYIKRQMRQAVQKLSEQRPVSIGQASRISGVSPADISVLLVYMESMRQG